MNARFEATGTWVRQEGDCTVTQDWFGSGDIPATATPANPGRSCGYGGLIDAQQSVAQLVAEVVDTDGAQTKTHGNVGFLHPDQPGLVP